MPPREYDVTPPPTRLAERVQLRTAFTAEQGEVVRFLTQLEYWLDGDWRAVVRYDHDTGGADEAAHDVTEDGLHRDVYRDGEKVRTVDVTPPLPSTDAFNYAEDDLRENYERYIKRFEQWHNIPNEDQ